MRVAIACEGRTDFVLLEQLVLAVFGPCDITPLVPLRDALDDTRWSPQAGWTQVKAWCERLGVQGIADEMAMGTIDVIVVHVDGDMCGREGHPATRAGLCVHIKQTWMGDPTPPPGVVICIPASATDTWLAAALDAAIATPALEADPDPLSHLVRSGVLKPAPPGETTPRKNQYAYQQRASVLRNRAAALRPALTELDRFMGKLEARSSGRS